VVTPDCVAHLEADVDMAPEPEERKEEDTEGHDEELSDGLGEPVDDKLCTSDAELQPPGDADKVGSAERDAGNVGDPEELSTSERLDNVLGDGDKLKRLESDAATLAEPPPLGER
jgi:hypothetical protein